MSKAPEEILFVNHSHYNEKLLLRAAQADQPRSYKIQCWIAMVIFTVATLISALGTTLVSKFFMVVFLLLTLTSFLFYRGEPKRRSHDIYQGFLRDYGTEIDAQTTVTAHEITVSYDGLNIMSSCPLNRLLELSDNEHIYVVKTATGLSIPLDKRGFSKGSPLDFEQFIKDHLKNA